MADTIKVPEVPNMTQSSGVKMTTVQDAIRNLEDEHDEIGTQKSTGDSCKESFTEEKTAARESTDNEELQDAETNMILVHEEQFKGMDIADVLQGDIDITFMDRCAYLLKQHFKVRMRLPQALYLSTKQQGSCTIPRVPKEKPFVQIHYVINHYVVSAQIDGQLYVFDSIDSKAANGHNSVLLHQLTYVYDEVDESRIQYRVLQSQEAERLCAFFAAANAFAILQCIQQNIDIPKVTEFDTTQMRQHFHACLEESKLSAFPCCEQLQPEVIHDIPRSKVVPIDSYTHLLVDISTMPKDEAPSNVLKALEELIGEECICQVTVLLLPGTSKELREEIDKFTVSFCERMKIVDKGKNLQTLKIKKERIIGYISFLVGVVDVCSPSITNERILLVSDEQTKKSIISEYEYNNFWVLQWLLITSRSSQDISILQSSPSSANSTAGKKMKNCLRFIRGNVTVVFFLDLDNFPNFFDIFEGKGRQLKCNVHIICFANKKTSEIKIEKTNIRSKVPENITFAPVCENQKNQVDYDIIKYIGFLLASVCSTKNNLISINVILSNDKLFEWICHLAKELQEKKFPNSNLKIRFWPPTNKVYYNKLISILFSDCELK